MRSFGIRRFTPLFFILPCIVILLAVSIFPLVYSLWLSFNSWELAMGLPKRFIGLGNYIRLFQDIRFWLSMKNMGKVLLFGVGSQFLIGFALALLLNREFRSRTLVATLFLLPTMIAPVVIGCTWRQIYHYSYGPLNYFLQATRLSGGINWLADIKLALPSIIISDTWEWTPFMMVVLLAGLQSIPVDLQEVAAIDGASRWQIFWHITLPFLKPIIIVVILIRAMDAFKLFDLVVLLTRGGPGGSSETVAYYNYLSAFKHFSMGYAAAMSYIQLVVIIIIANFFLRFLRE
ncbi:MAG: sugar ABC transporter permease [Candidatus Aerophobus sp.]|nr:MAG: sugar ABC transporter permease [Candidatus Aerophobus sp.]